MEAGSSGTPAASRYRKGRTTKRREIVLEAEAAAQANRETSLQYLRRLMNDPEATLARRDRAAETLARIEADILLRMEERARGGGLGEYDRCNTKAELRTAIADDLRRSESCTGGAPDMCGLEHEDMLDLMFAFLDGDQRYAWSWQALLGVRFDPASMAVDWPDCADGSPPVATLQLSKLRQQARLGSLRRHQSSDQCITPEKSL
jgi:hypothetical protein